MLSTEPNRFPIKLLLIWTLVLAAFLTASLCATGMSSADGPRASENAVWSPNSFSDEFNAGIASDGHDLWLVTNGLDAQKKVRLRVYRFSDGRWSALPGGPRTTTASIPQVAVESATPHRQKAVCVGDTKPGDLARIRCFEKGHWVEKELPRYLRHHLLNDLQVTNNGNLRALFLDQTLVHHPYGFHTTVQLASLEGDKFVASGPPLRISKQAIAKLVTETEGTDLSAPGVGITLTSEPTKRWIASLRNGEWISSHPLPGELVGGTLTSGPVRSGAQTFFPVNQTEFPITRDYEASIYSEYARGPWREVGDRPLNTGLGSAQTNLYPVGHRVWAIWLENDFAHSNFGGMIRTGVFAARIDPSGHGYDRELNLWKGKTVFPVVPQVVALKGKPVFLYMRQRGRDSGMHATVEFVRE